MMNTPSFTYRKSYRIAYRGCCLHSLLELKFVLSIEEEYRFLRAPVPIWYHPATHTTTDYFQEGIKTYTPDFLIRHKQTGQAYLIELKPTGYNLQPAISIYNSIAAHYISRHGYDWAYKIVFDQDIRLTDAQSARFRLLANKRESFKDLFALAHFDHRCNTDVRPHFQSVPNFSEPSLDKKAYARWVKRGDQPFV
jgi:hypothetical protein